MHPDKRYLGIPYAFFLLLFVILPMVVILYYALTNGQGQFTWKNVIDFFINPRTIGTLFYSVVVASTTTVICLVIAYPTAYILARGAFAGKAALLAFIIMPMWINFTLRMTALKEFLNFIEGNMAYYPFLNTVTGQTYDFLPFMILPLYTTLSKMDPALVEAAGDLGAKPQEVFFRVILPLSLPGIISGVTMVFLPAMTNYVVLDMLYNSTYIMGSLIGSYFSSYDWHNGSMISAVLLIGIALVGFVGDRLSEGGADEE